MMFMAGSTEAGLNIIFKILNVILALLLLFFPAFSFCEDTSEEDEPPEELPLEEPVELKYNPYTGLFEEVKPEESVPAGKAEKDKAKEEKSSLQLPETTPLKKPSLSETRYNPYTGEFEQTRMGEELKYIPSEGEWRYETGKTEPAYNPYTGEIEEVSPGESLYYNPVEDNWSYQ